MEKQKKFSVYVDYQDDLFLICKNGQQIFTIPQNLSFKNTLKQIQESYSRLNPNLDLETFYKDVSKIVQKIIEQIF